MEYTHLAPSIQILNNKNSTWPWAKSKGIFFKGYFFYNNILYTELDACEFISKIEHCQLSQMLAQFNGSFAILTNNETQKWAATDRLRSMPLFYYICADKLLLGDDPEILIKNGDHHIGTDERSLNEYLLNGFCIGNTTLIKHLYQLRAGELTNFCETGNPKSSLYFSHIGKTRELNDVEHEFKALDEISDNWTKRLITSAQGRQIVIPLSGGYDSRYIACQLVKHGVKNIISYTYGIPASPEVSRSRAIANELGLEWHFIDYTQERFETFLNSSEHDEYLNYAHLYSSTPHYQEFLALQYLVEESIIQKNAIIVPGFCGDLLGGSFVPLEIKMGKFQNLANTGLDKYVLSKQYYLSIFLRDHVNEDMRSHLKKELDFIGWREGYEKDPQKFVSYNDAFFIHHKVAKYVINSLRVYEYFGLQWRMPLWDNELMDYWYSIPYTARSDDPLYNKYLSKNIFTPLRVNLSKPESGKLVRVEKLFIKNTFIRPFRRIVTILLARILQTMGRRESTGFNIPNEYYNKKIEIQGESLPGTPNLVAVLTRWIVYKNYSAKRACAPVK